MSFRDNAAANPADTENRCPPISANGNKSLKKIKGTKGRCNQYGHDGHN